ncbi:hypothetical protein DN752_21895 [Echinicola strongylocentroti]|uniref:Nitroreductase domain-containing protein n=1 Tax=Echinicola strongylocentroti TaxID=1795355 RepID=A0A2Z4IPV6_9BACT|nr:nitroreductase family protein [Echinicola strongylocentroti]AWW32586.1 hypothetical protein DN752_21895 [Echinicola strongylocentroti]
MYAVIKKHFPSLLNLGVLWVYALDFYKYTKHSSVAREDTSVKLVSRIIADYHVIEKGLTMPSVRLGFGVARMHALLESINAYVEQYGATNEQVCCAIGVVKEYKDFHTRNDYQIDENISKQITSLEQRFPAIANTVQKRFSEGNYYAQSKASFDDFSRSRLSVRNYDPEKEVPVDKIEKAVNLATNAPSSCNRQTVRVHVYKDRDLVREILAIQGGNRGFGDRANKLIIVTSDLQCWHGVSENKAPYVDGGVFTMNLLYALHFYKIASCPLNCNLSPEKEKSLRKICGIPKSEVFVVMVSCGLVPEEFEVPASRRYTTPNILTIHN